MRLENHPILEFDRGEKVKFYYNGQEMEGYTSETVAAALHAAGVRVLGHSPELHRPRGLFCAIGNCSSCFMTVDGEPNVRVCVTKVRAGMRVEEQHGKGVVQHDKGTGNTGHRRRAGRSVRCCCGRVYGSRGASVREGRCSRRPAGEADP